MPFPSSDADWDAIARLVAGELPESEAVPLRARIEKDAALTALVSALATPTQRVSTGVDLEKALARVHARIDAAAAAPSSAQSTARARPHLQVSTSRVWRQAQVLRAAAAILIIAIGGAVLLRPRAATAPVVASVVPSIHRTGVGQRDSLVLSDGTRIALGPGSSLTVPGDYPAHRDVVLNGEARFAVVHDAAHPFVVRTPEATVTDIGTSFTVRSYGGAGADVAVHDGVVALRSLARAQDSVVLRKGEAGAVGVDGSVRRAAAASAADTAWLKGQLVFREAPMVKVRSDLRRWYGIELLAADSALATQHFTGSFQRETRSQVLDIIALALGATYDVRGDTVILRPGRTPAR